MLPDLRTVRAEPGVGVGGLCPFDGLKVRMRFAKWACVVVEGGLGVKSMGFLDGEEERNDSGAGDAGRRICRTLDMELREMAV